MARFYINLAGTIPTHPGYLNKFDKGKVSRIVMLEIIGPKHVYTVMLNSREN